MIVAQCQRKLLWICEDCNETLVMDDDEITVFVCIVSHSNHQCSRLSYEVGGTILDMSNFKGASVSVSDVRCENYVFDVKEKGRVEDSGYWRYAVHMPMTFIWINCYFVPILIVCHLKVKDGKFLFGMKAVVMMKNRPSDVKNVLSVKGIAGPQDMHERMGYVDLDVQYATGGMGDMLLEDCHYGWSKWTWKSLEMRCDGQSKVFCLFYTIRVKFAEDFKKLFSTTIPVEKFDEAYDRIHDVDLAAKSNSSEDPVEDTSNPEDRVEEGEDSQNNVNNFSDNCTDSPAKNLSESNNAESVNIEFKPIDERCKVDEGSSQSFPSRSSNASVVQKISPNEQKGICRWLPQVPIS